MGTMMPLFFWTVLPHMTLPVLYSQNRTPLGVYPFVSDQQEFLAFFNCLLELLELSWYSKSQ